MRLSASGLVGWERCPRQWFHRTKQGLSGAVNPEMILGIIVEEALIGLLMEDPGEQLLDTSPSWVLWKKGEKPPSSLQYPEPPESLQQIRDYLLARVENTAAQVIELGAEQWKTTPTTAADRDWTEMKQSRIEELLRAGIEFQLEEVERCHAAGGGPHLQHWRVKGDPHFVCAPRWSHEARFPIPDKVPGHSLKLALGNTDEPAQTVASKEQVSWPEAWQIARPWMKDPRVWQPQRLYHPEGWAAGELDLLLRWDGKARVVDIKSGDGSSGWAAGLASQLRFYQWLFLRTRTSEHLIDEVSSLEGWYLGSGKRDEISLWDEQELEQQDALLKQIWQQMSAADGDSSTWPEAKPAAWKGESTAQTCSRCQARFFCTTAPEEQRQEGLASILPERLKGASRAEVIEDIEPREPALPIGEIPNRVNITGTLGGRWGPMSNHFGEPVHGAVLSSGKQASVIIEEMAPGSCLQLKEIEDGPLLVLDAAPGVWRGSSRIYLDSRSRLLKPDEADEVETTRLGLLPKRANVDGLVVSRRRNSGQRLDGKPWTMATCHLWDGHDIIEVVVFGWGVTETFSDLEVGDRLLVMAAELGWRAGLAQLRLSPRGSRIEVRPRDWQPADELPDSVR